MLRWNRDRRVAARSLAAAALGALLLAGCVAGPDFTPPPAPKQQAYTRGTLHELTSAGPAPDSALPEPRRWWRVLNCPSLNQTIRRALAGNRTLAAAQATLQEAQQQFAASTGAAFPRVNLNAGAGREKYGAAFIGPQRFAPFTYFSVGPAVSFLFDYAGGVRRTIEQRQALAEYRAHQLDAAALSLSGHVALEALAAASARAQIGTAEALVGEDRTNLALVQDAYRAGSATRVDVLHAQSQLANDQTLLPPLRSALASANDALALLVGSDAAQFVPPAFELGQMSLPHRLPLRLPSQLVHERPDILAAESELHAATAAVGVATANLYPQITLTGSAALESLTFDSALFSSQAGAGGISGSLVAPLFDHGELRARQRAAQAAMRAALANYQQVVLSAFRQVADALQALDQDSALLAGERHALSITTQNLALTRESYEVGNSGVLQVLDAERQNQQARLGLIRAQVQRYRDAMRLLLASGGRIALKAGAPASSRSS